MNRSIFVILLISLAACNGSNSGKKQEGTDSTMISTSLVDNPNTANGIDSSRLNGMANMEFTDTVHDFGSIRQGETVVYEFDFVNNGKSPLIISSATGSCGCTIADYPHEPVLAGKGGKLKAIFNTSGKAGHQEKSISVATNSKRGIQMLYIKAEVEVSKNNSSAPTE